MKHVEYRTQVADCARLLVGHGLLDFTGGAISTRVDAGHHAITPGGSARRLWSLQPSDIVVVSRTGRDPDVRLPLGAALHARLYEELPALDSIIHTHAGEAFVASCLEMPLFPRLPPTEPLGDIRTLGLPSRVGQQPSGATETRAGVEEWVEMKTLGELRDLLPKWRQQIEHRGVVFLDYQHGAYVLGRDMNAAVVDLARLESSAGILFRFQASGTPLPAPHRPAPPN